MHHLVYYLIAIPGKFKLNQAEKFKLNQPGSVCLGVSFFIMPYLHLGFQDAQKKYNAIQKESWTSTRKLLYER